MAHSPVATVVQPAPGPTGALAVPAAHPQRRVMIVVPPNAAPGDAITVVDPARARPAPGTSAREWGRA
eukprot:CAMPEP_0185717816 /NCGR_PEP_ID=MMETSP1164-20130828/45573_1 /TAXON_ID=1104430 /ORGANISM="Chrysoreinhardia sp, Strain CCMP2950" /LENGTH=67 /DNA_ID=CAMNT_0028385461 /DNA_START=82 /DNA_END=282 /DNA_ORIENTATION=-